MSTTPQGFSLWPRADYAEDQQYARTILTTHVLHRGFQTGATVGLVAGAARVLYSRSRGTQYPSTTTASATFTPSATLSSTAKSPYTVAMKTILRSAGRSGIITSLAMGAMLPFYMRSVGGDDAEDVQYAWQDRAYRLLYNEGQVSVDRWSVAGMAVGGAGALVGSAGSVLSLMGRLGVGSLGGVVVRGLRGSVTTEDKTKQPKEGDTVLVGEGQPISP